MHALVNTVRFMMVHLKKQYRNGNFFYKMAYCMIVLLFYSDSFINSNLFKFLFWICYVYSTASRWIKWIKMSITILIK